MIEKTQDRTPNPAIEEEWPDEKKLGAVRTLIKHRELIGSLVYRDIRTRYKQSVLGVAWALINPIAMTLVYTVVFSVFLKVKAPAGIPYPVFAFTALLPWTVFSQGINMGTESLVNNFNLITKIYFPREILPITVVFSKLVDLALGVIVLIATYIICGVGTSWLVVVVIPTLVVQILLALGVTFFLSAANLFYRDIKHVVQLLMIMWMYMTPIVYPITQVPGKILPIYKLNPMVSIIETYRNVAMLGLPPDWRYLGFSAAVSVVILILGYRFFKKLEPAFAEAI